MYTFVKQNKLVGIDDRNLDMINLNIYLIIK